MLVSVVVRYNYESVATLKLSPYNKVCKYQASLYLIIGSLIFGINLYGMSNTLLLYNCLCSYVSPSDLLSFALRLLLSLFSYPKFALFLILSWKKMKILKKEY